MGSVKRKTSDTADFHPDPDFDATPHTRLHIDHTYAKSPGTSK